MTVDQAQLLWIRAHVMLHARCPNSTQWQEADLYAAFATLTGDKVTPFDAWCQRAGLASSAPIADAPPPTEPKAETAAQIKEQLEAQFGPAVPLYDPRSKGPLQWP